MAKAGFSNRIQRIALLWISVQNQRLNGCWPNSPRENRAFYCFCRQRLRSAPNCGWADGSPNPAVGRGGVACTAQYLLFGRWSSSGFVEYAWGLRDGTLEQQQAQRTTIEQAVREGKELPASRGSAMPPRTDWVPAGKSDATTGAALTGLAIRTGRLRAVGGTRCAARSGPVLLSVSS